MRPHDINETVDLDYLPKGYVEYEIDNPNVLNTSLYLAHGYENLGIHLNIKLINNSQEVLGEDARHELFIDGVKYDVKERQINILEDSFIKDIGIFLKKVGDYNINRLTKEEIIETLNYDKYLKRLQLDCSRHIKDFQYNDNMCNQLIMLIGSMLDDPERYIYGMFRNNIAVNIMNKEVKKVCDKDWTYYDDLVNVANEILDDRNKIPHITIDNKRLFEYSELLRTSLDKLFLDVSNSMYLYCDKEIIDKFFIDLDIFTGIVSIFIDFLYIFTDNYTKIEKQLYDLLEQNESYVEIKNNINRKLEKVAEIKYQSTLSWDKPDKPKMSFDVIDVPDVLFSTVSDKLLLKNRDVINYYKDLLIPAICRELINYNYGETLLLVESNYKEDISYNTDEIIDAYKNSKYSDERIMSMSIDFLVERKSDYLLFIWGLQSVIKDEYDAYSGHNGWDVEEYKNKEAMVLALIIGLHLRNYEQNEIFYSLESKGIVINQDIMDKIRNIELEYQHTLKDNNLIDELFEMEPGLLAHPDIVEEISKRIEKETNGEIKAEALIDTIELPANPIQILNINVLLNMLENINIRELDKGNPKKKFILQEYLGKINKIINYSIAERLVGD